MALATEATKSWSSTSRLCAARSTLPGAQIRVGQAFVLRFFYGVGSRQDPLTFVAFPAARPFHHDCPNGGVFGGAAGHGRVAAWQELEVAEVGTFQTKRLL